MALHAVDDLGDAFAATRAFLLPFDVGTWLRLALVAFFVGGVGGNVPTSGTQFGGETVDIGQVGTTPPDVGGQALTLLLLVGSALAILGLLLGFLGSVMEFVLVRSLREEEVHVRRYVGEHWRAGARLFGFRIVLVLLGGLLVTLPLLALLFGVVGSGGFDGPGRILGLVLVLVPLALLVAVAFSLVNGFTTFFVVPVMLLEGSGVLASWRRFYRTLRSEWKEYIAFAVLTFVLTLVLGTMVGFVVGIVALLVFGPLVLLGFAGVAGTGVFGFGGGAASLPVLVALGLVGLLALLLVLFVAALVRVPVVTYLRYYALLVLGDTDGDLDLVPERRRAIRTGGGTDSVPESGPESA
jgi:preprotein translocase subunit Sss1